jgi:hypothetical protein
MNVSFRKKWTFWQRLGRELLFFGTPMVCLELIGLPLFGWATALALVVPTTVVGLFAYTAAEHLLVSALVKGEESK